jgi:hypothetical protein
MSVERLESGLQEEGEEIALSNGGMEVFFVAVPYDDSSGVVRIKVYTPQHCVSIASAKQS